MAVLNSFPGRGFAYDVRPSFDGNAAQDIYSGISTHADASVTDKLQELEGQLRFLNGTSYGTVAAGSFEYTVTAENI